MGNNLYGIEIDERSGELAAFALTMKAREKYKRFLNKPVQPNICVLENVQFDEGELKHYMDFIGRDLFTASLQTTLRQFEEADNFGSLICPDVTDVAGMLKILESKNVSEHLFLSLTHQKVLQVLRQADYLSPKYYVVIANPPYMGKKNMNARLQSWLFENYSTSCPDFFATFIERSLKLQVNNGLVSMITMDSWMFGDDYTDFREQILSKYDIQCLAHLGPHAFEEIKGEVVQVAAFIFRNPRSQSNNGIYCDLTAYPSPLEKEQAFLNGSDRYKVLSITFYELPRNVFAYFISPHTRQAFKSGVPLKQISEAFTGLQTGDNERFIRRWTEISKDEICFSRTEKDTIKYKSMKWFPYVKGSEYRKWYGNNEFVLNWQFDGSEIKAHKSSTVRNQQYYFRSGLAYNNISNKLCTRMVGTGHVFDQKNSMLFSKNKDNNEFTMSFLHSKVVTPFLRAVAPKDFGPGSMKLLPVISDYRDLYSVNRLAREAVCLAKSDWDAYEISWDFTSPPLLQHDYRQTTLKTTYQKHRAHWNQKTIEIQRLEEENNRIFIEAYGLQDELTPDVPLNEITLTCNPFYRYGNNKNFEKLESMLLADAMKEFISYAVGCMFGRYSLDQEGLILANQGEAIDDYDKKVYGNNNGQPKCLVDPDSVHLRPHAKTHCFSCGTVINLSEALFILADIYEAEYVSGRPMVYCQRCYEEKKDRISLVKPLPDFSLKDGLLQRWTGPETFEIFLEMADCFDYRMRPANEIAMFRPDNDNVIPALDEGWFSDDITERFQKFLKVTFGEDHYEENLTFLEEAIGKDIRRYFLKDFYNDHVKRYKKRPIYWLFSSPKGSFNALIYMHRYRPDTVSIVLNDYLREFRTKLSARKDHLDQISISASASQREKTQSLKDIEKLRKMINELDEYERDILYPLATKQISIDLDDGVKVNYQKFGKALKKIPGLDSSED